MKSHDIRYAILSLLRITKNKLLRLKMRSWQDRLRKKKQKQMVVFNSLKDDFFDIYKNFKKYDISRFVAPLWKDFNARVEKVFLPSPPFSFLNNPIIMFTMFGGRALRRELEFLEKRISKKTLKRLLEEDYIGDPPLINSTYLTSSNNIAHLYHMFKYIEETGYDFNRTQTIIEWGGGYGNMAKLFKRLIRKRYTYIIIDLPLFSTLQWLYLTTIFGKENVHIIKTQKDKIIKYSINLLPLCFLESQKLEADLFISTWGLSESSRYAQDYVVNKNWFNVKHLLLGYQKKTDELVNTDRVGRLAKIKGATVKDVGFISDNYYAFL